MQRDISKAFKLRGLGLGRDSLVLLEEHLRANAQPKKELARVVEHVVASGELNTARVPVDLIEDALRLEGQNDGDTQEDIMILDHKSMPINAYDYVRKTFTRHPGTFRSLAETPDEGAPFHRILALKERFQIMEQRVLRHKVFAKPAFARGKGNYQQLTPISGVRRAEGTVCVLGMLTQPHAGRFFLEDGSHSVELDLSTAKSTQGLFTENCIILVEGGMEGDILRAEVIAMPPVEERKETCRTFPALAVPTHRHPYSDKEAQQLIERERKDVNTEMIVLSDVWLDRASVLRGLRLMLGKYDELCAAEERRLLFVFMGNFTSLPAARGYARHRHAFAELAGLLEALPSLLESSSFIFVPGPHDVAGSRGNVLPRNPLPDTLTADFKARIPAASFTSSPCRVKFYSQDIVLHREDVCATLRRHSRRPDEESGAALASHAMQTVLKQGHLRPLPLHAGPIDWGYDHALRLYPLPDVLLIGDRSEHFEFKVGDTHAANPGSFAADLTFYTYCPATRQLEACQCSVEDADADDAARRVEGGTKKGKGKKDRRKRAKKAQVEGGVEGTPKDRQKVSKKRSKTTPTGGKETAELRGHVGGIESFFGPAHHKPILGGEDMEVEGGGGGRSRKRRVRRQADSESESESDESEGGGGDEGEGEGEGEEGGGEGGRARGKRARVLQESDEEDEDEDADEEGGEEGEGSSEGEGSEAEDEE